MRGLKYCPSCGKEKRFECQCEYGKLMKMKMEPNERQKDFFSKKHCPKCGSSCTQMTCKECGFSYSDEDFWHVKSW